MLHALLHRKLDESIPEPHRLEDALTSTVFGVLVWMEAWDTLTQWLGLPHGATTAGSSNACWFWPRLALAEPDVVLRVGNVLVVVEAKYRSGRHDRVAAIEDAEPALCNQLHLQHRCIVTPRDRRKSYPEPLERAIRECELVQTFIVDRRRLRRATREFAESTRELPHAVLKLATWQDLFRLLAESRTAGARWSRDLIAYLQLLGLDTFDGIRMSAAAVAELRSVAAWRAQHHRRGIRAAAASFLNEPAAVHLRAWPWRP
jgi:hypothetical protein